MKGVACAAAFLPIVALLGWASHADATIVKIPLSQMVIGSEVTNSTLAPNGGFEQNLNGDTPQFPINWNSMNSAVMTATPVHVPAGHESYFGNFAFQAQSARLANEAYTGYMKQAEAADHWPVALQENTDYVVSAYVWVIGNADHHMRATIDLADVSNELEMRVSWDEPHAAQGLFIYGIFNTGQIGGNQTRPTLRVFADSKVGLDAAVQTLFPVVVQFDNVRVTPLADFVAPTPVPEPVSMSLLALGELAMLRRRRQR